jgi:hypothetical protein
MELLFVLVISAGIGLLARMASGNRRHSYGLTLVPAISVAVSAVVWIALLWSGQTFDGGWIWLISLVVGPLVALIVALRLPHRREVTDRALLTKLSSGKA